MLQGAQNYPLACGCTIACLGVKLPNSFAQDSSAGAFWKSAREQTSNRLSTPSRSKQQPLIPSVSSHAAARDPSPGHPIGVGDLLHFVPQKIEAGRGPGAFSAGDRRWVKPSGPGGRVGISVKTMSVWWCKICPEPQIGFSSRPAETQPPFQPLLLSRSNH